MSITFFIPAAPENEENPAPELNLSNVNAAAVLAAIGIACDPHGDSMGPEQLSQVRRSIVRALNVDLSRHERPADEGMGPRRGARLISQGLDADGIRERLTRLDAVLAWAQEHNMEVAWG